MTRRDVDKLQEEIEELFADLWQVPRFSGIRHGFRPNVDCFHTDDPHLLTVLVELPAVDPESVQIAQGISLHGVVGRRIPQTWARTMEYVRSGAVDVAALITHHHAMSEIDEVVDLIKSGQCGKVSLRPG